MLRLGPALLLIVEGTLRYVRATRGARRTHSLHIVIARMGNDPARYPPKSRGLNGRSSTFHSPYRLAGSIL